MKRFEMSCQSGRLNVSGEAEERLTAQQKTDIALAAIASATALGMTYMTGTVSLIICAVLLFFKILLGMFKD